MRVGGRGDGERAYTTLALASVPEGVARAGAPVPACVVYLVNWIRIRS